MFLNLAYMWMIAAVFDTLVPFYASYQLGLSTFGVGAIFAVVLVAEFAVLYPAGSAADRHGRKTVLVPALAGLAAATVSVGRAGTPLLFGVGLASLGVASGFAGVPPAAMPSDITPDGTSGTAIGAFRFFGDLGLMLGPAVAGDAAKSFASRRRSRSRRSPPPLRYSSSAGHAKRSRPLALGNSPRTARHGAGSRCPPSKNAPRR
jgi:MFS family permease